MRALIGVILLAALIGLHMLLLGKTVEAWKALPQDESNAYTVSSPLLRVVSLEYDGLISNYLFVKTMVYIGGNLQKDKPLRLPEHGWKWIYHTLDVSTDMDPHFVDPYYVGNAYLTWDAGMVKEANALLEKGSRARDWDWTLPFFIGFNYFYFFQDNVKATEYLMEASRRPNASPILASLTSKLAYKANRTENSIRFLEEILMTTDDASLRREYETRIEALQAILFLEKAADLYRQQFGKKARHVTQLVQRGIIKEVPKDPYGGQFYLDPDGRIKTTSEDKLLPYSKRTN